MTYMERIAGSLTVAALFLLLVLSTAKAALIDLAPSYQIPTGVTIPSLVGKQMWEYHYFYQFGHLFFLAAAILGSLLMIRKLPPLLPGLPDELFREEEEGWNA